MIILKDQVPQSIAGILEDIPQNVIENHGVLQKHSRIYCADTPPPIENIIVHVPYEDNDFTCFGSNTDHLLSLLEKINGTEKIDGIIVESKHKNQVIEYFKRVHSRNLVAYRSITHVLNETPEREPQKAILLSHQDLKMLNQASEYFDWYGFNSVEDMLSAGYIARVIEDDQLVSVAYTSAFSERYVDIGIRTKSDYRGREYAFESALKLLHSIHSLKQVPVWNAMEDNLPSLAVCKKLGFREVSEKFYLGDEYV